MPEGVLYGSITTGAHHTCRQLDREKGFDAAEDGDGDERVDLNGRFNDLRRGTGQRNAPDRRLRFDGFDQLGAKAGFNRHTME